MPNYGSLETFVNIWINLSNDNPASGNDAKFENNAEI